MWTVYALIGIVCFIAGLGVGFVIGGYYSPYARAVMELVKMVREFIEED